MISLLGLGLGGLMATVAILFLIKGLRGFAVVRRVLARPTVPIATVDEGHVEVAGRVSAIGEPLLTLSGEWAVAVFTVMRGQSGTGKGSTTKGQRGTTRVAETRVADGSGATCRLDLELCEIVGDRWTSKTFPVESLADIPWAYALVPDGSTHVTVEEVVVPEGAAVLVAAEAELPPPTPGSGSYRDPVAREWVLKGRPANLLVLSVGTQQRLIARAVVPAMVIVAASIYLAAVAVIIVAVALSS